MAQPLSFLGKAKCSNTVFFVYISFESEYKVNNRYRHVAEFIPVYFPDLAPLVQMCYDSETRLRYIPNELEGVINSVHFKING